ncbi:hypothetical protein XF_1027 [Xylella fastidiosa 9a5c]|uniref:Uncharacterized protein n=1 Tax=Xylella fastidiosa (strain 9a5c) TaxID=160492 RepID=Q9PEK1_XYLFA|nr:hypothetical protein XF_1027 [Xylella fastidiosa 9a5c]
MLSNIPDHEVHTTGSFDYAPTDVATVTTQKVLTALGRTHHLLQCSRASPKDASPYEHKQIQPIIAIHTHIRTAKKHRTVAH